jgi:ATPase subunit of ABC transporter with duplicated ATPase domains
LLAWYFSQVWPSSVGVHKPFYFLLTPSYWFPKDIASSSSRRDDSACLGDNRVQAEESPASKDDIPVEEANERILGAPTVTVKNLRKTFGKNRVINDLNFNMYENQIFCLLGHNGAGKASLFLVFSLL